MLLFGILILRNAHVALQCRQIRESQNVALPGKKRANKSPCSVSAPPNATWRSRTAMRFYEESSRVGAATSALFNIPVANLTKENVRESCTNGASRPEESQRFHGHHHWATSQAQYSPAASARMTEVYGEGVDIISRIEAMIKNDRNSC